MSNPTPTTQAVEQLREKVLEFAKYCTVQGTPFGTMPNDEDKLSEFISALADTIKIVFDNREDYIKLCRSVGLGSSSEDSAFNQGLSAGLHLQRQRLELVVKEMKAK